MARPSGDWTYALALWSNDLLNRARRKLGLPYWSLSAWAKLKVKNAVNFIGEFEHVLAEEAAKTKVSGVSGFPIATYPFMVPKDVIGSQKRIFSPKIYKARPCDASSLSEPSLPRSLITIVGRIPFVSSGTASSPRSTAFGSAAIRTECRHTSLSAAMAMNFSIRKCPWISRRLKRPLLLECSRNEKVNRAGFTGGHLA